MLQCGSFSFPIHISHVMQPFDLAVAAPLKSQLKISISNDNTSKWLHVGEKRPLIPKFIIYL